MENELKAKGIPGKILIIQDKFERSIADIGKLIANRVLKILSLTDQADSLIAVLKNLKSNYPNLVSIVLTGGFGHHGAQYPTFIFSDGTKLEGKDLQNSQLDQLPKYLKNESARLLKQ